MPFCPQCFTEYQPGIAECDDCHVPLLEGTQSFCPKCEEPVSPGDSFCDHCGILLLQGDEDTMPDCAVHPDRPAVAGCVVCGKPVCDECGTELEGKVFCDDDSHVNVHQDFAVAYRTSAEYEAEMVKANLESAGITVKLFDQHGHIYFVDIGGMALVNVMVPKDQLERAKEITDAILASAPLEDDATPEGDTAA